MNKEICKLLIVTGLSGAGMSSALKSLEDLGYEVIDNFPLSLVEPLLEQEESTGKSIAIGIDSRTRGFNPSDLVAMAEKYSAELLYVTCDDAVLQKRFTETRRRHPVAKDRPVSDGIRREHELLEPLKDKADHIIDTTNLSIHDLRRMMEERFALGESRLMVTLMSFGYKNGLPREADIVMDVRFLRNPHWDESLRPLTGRDEKVGDYIDEDENLNPFLNNFRKLLETVLPRYSHEGKNYLTVALGCTGGKHRSVYVSEKIAETLKSRGINVHVTHRDIPAD
jgi:UPF0042 nucleotide-binding protein